MGKVARIAADIRRRNSLDAYIGWLLALLVTGLQLVAGFWTDQSWVTVVVSATMVLLLGIVALATAEIRRVLATTNFASPGRARVFIDRAQLPPLRGLLESSHRTVEIYGVQLGHIVHHLLPVIAEQATADCRFRLALLSPVYPDGEKVPWVNELGAVHGFANLEDVLRANIAQLRHWHASLTPKQRRNIEIRGFSAIPTASVILVDTDRTMGFVHVEPILHAIAPSDRPTFWVTKADSSKLYNLVVDHYHSVWTSATSLEDLAL
ncbi:hypothetical protein AB0C84_03565 [Actinomadura sp. NPDC048955]|uniref:hypothetical protein n=1 Tax=Actinomadura sp. NPDC048955 TaxID=3158228 RepID=UPI0033EE25A2